MSPNLLGVPADMVMPQLTNRDLSVTALREVVAAGPGSSPKHPGPPPLPIVCCECGNDDACEGYAYCSDCLELLFP